MDRKQKITLFRILIGGLLLAVVSFLPTNGLVRFSTFLLPYFAVGYDILLKAIRNILRGQVFDENLLMMLATLGAFAIGEYPEAVFVMLFYQVGEWFQRYAVGKSRRSIASLLEIRPDYANVMKEGKLQQIDPEEIAVGDTIHIQPGEKIPLDGIVLTGSSSLSTVALTGEAIPKDVFPGDKVISGCINGNGLLTVKVTKTFADSTVVKILELVEEATANKARSQRFITKFSRYYTPAVVIFSLLLAILPPLISGGHWQQWLHRALIFLVVSCPCALVISVPLSFFGGIGGASRQGILIKGAGYMETLAKAKRVVFDKTGTLTKGSFEVTEIHPTELSRQQLLQLAATVEQFSNHPIALSLKGAYKGALLENATDFSELPGRGITARINNDLFFVGNSLLMKEIGIYPPEQPHIGTVLHIASRDKYLGFLVIADRVKSQAKQAIHQLRALGIEETVMLTGDRETVARQVASTLTIDRAYGELLPADKVSRMEEIMASSKCGTLLFVGDGINDAPVLARADVGIAMGGIGSDAAMEAADVVLMDDNLTKLSLAIRIARRTLAIVRQNIVFALSVKLLVLLLAAFGQAYMWQAVFADVGVSALAILNAMRGLKTK